jgi:hypothetical protein
VFTRPTRLPFYFALILALPLFLTALQSSSLALDRPQLFKIKGNDQITTGTAGIPDASGNVGSTDEQASYQRWPGGLREEPTTSALERRIWLWALLPVGILVGIGLVLSRIRHGTYATLIAGMALAMAATWRLDAWAARHTARYPLGYDLKPNKSPEDRFLKGEWEHSARQAASEMRWFVVVLAAGLIAVLLVTAYLKKRRAGLDAPLPPGSTSAVDAVTAESVMLGGGGGVGY